MSRVTSREEAFKLVFEYCVSGEINELSVNELFETREDIDKDYVKTVYYGIAEHFEELKYEIANVSKSFSVDRIFKVDLALLILALYEIKYLKEIPDAVSINEALNLSKIYSTEKSAPFINGVLSNFVKEK